MTLNQILSHSDTIPYWCNIITTHTTVSSFVLVLVLILSQPKLFKLLIRDKILLLTFILGLSSDINPQNVIQEQPTTKRTPISLCDQTSLINTQKEFLHKEQISININRNIYALNISDKNPTSIEVPHQTTISEVNKTKQEKTTRRATEENKSTKEHIQVIENHPRYNELVSIMTIKLELGAKSKLQPEENWSSISKILDEIHPYKKTDIGKFTIVDRARYLTSTFGITTQATKITNTNLYKKLRGYYKQKA